jgi:hypothetical protein
MNKRILLLSLCCLSGLLPLPVRAERLPAFGVIADIQFGDKEGSVSRDYRGSLSRLEQCVTDLNKRDLDFVIQVGDIIDGYGTSRVAAAVSDLDSVLSIFNRLSPPKYHVVGNHCQSAGKENLLQRLGLKSFYYTFANPAAKGWRFIVLDGNDAGYGIMSDAQLDWFRAELGKAQQAGEKVICFCHFPLLQAAAESHRMNKPEPVLAALDAAPCVVAWVAGHDHNGGYARRKGVHHLTLRGLVEAPGSTAYARFEIAPDSLKETGFGNEPSRELPLATHAPTRRLSFENGPRWPSDTEPRINAHGGGILFREGVYYWYGEHKIEGKAGNVAHVGVHVYSSRDLFNWKDEGIALAVSGDPASDITKECVLERPKVIFNATTGKYVMWFHLELKGKGYNAARSGVAVSDTPTGPFTYLRSERPDAGVWPVNVTDEQKAALQTVEQMKGLTFSGGPNADTPKHSILARDFAGGQMARDMTLFVDDDQKAYHIFASEENSTLHISLLSDDYLSHAGTYVRVFEHRWSEAPALCKRQGRYWMLASGCTGWAPNAARAAVADSIWGPWKELENPCRGVNPLNKLGAEKTFGGQSTFILPVQGKRDAFIALFDLWKPDNAIDGRYVWLPMRFAGEGFTLTWANTWDLSAFE